MNLISNKSPSSTSIQNCMDLTLKMCSRMNTFKITKILTNQPVALTVDPWLRRVNQFRILLGHYHYHSVCQIWEQLIQCLLGYCAHIIYMTGGGRVADGGRPLHENMISPDPSNTGKWLTFPVWGIPIHVHASVMHQGPYLLTEW